MDNYDKITNETLDKAYKKFLKINENKQPLSDINYYQSDNTTSQRGIPHEIYSNNGYDRSFIDKKMFINGYEIKPELMDKIKFTNLNHSFLTFLVNIQLIILFLSYHN